MKIAVISDIHGNLYSLMRVYEDIEEQKADLVICLGDLVGYGPHLNEVVSFIRRKNILCLKGNYDASVVAGDYSFIRNNSVNSFALPWAVEELRASNKIYLDSLPTSMSLSFNNRSIKFVHGSPNKINEYLLEDQPNTINTMENLKEDILVCAHTHLPFAKSYGNKLLINSGSVGKPKIGNPNATYVIIDIDEKGQVLTNVKQVSYEYQRIIKDMQLLNFPSGLIRSYETGIE